MGRTSRPMVLSCGCFCANNKQVVRAEKFNHINYLLYELVVAHYLTLLLKWFSRWPRLSVKFRSLFGIYHLHSRPGPRIIDYRDDERYGVEMN